jgi:enoyl-CoA hydratase
MVICTEDASFALREPRIGIVSDIGALQRLPHIIGMANTKRMAYTSAFFSAEQVEKMGLVVEICPDVDSMMSAAQNLADQIKKSAPLAVQCCKEVINYNRYSSIQEGITLAVHKNMILLATEDFKEAITAFIEKRPPAFKGK